MQLDALLEQNRTNYYKMLVIVDNNQQHEKIINALKDKDWTSYDVNENVLRIVEDIPENKVKIRIADEIKKWINLLPEKLILYNTNILYSMSLGS
jgi:PleD family two-component response regulator